MHVVVLGAGAMGSLFAGRLAGTDASVTLLGHASEHVATVDRDGLVLQETDGTRRTLDLDVTTDNARASEADLLLVAVKSYDTADAMADVVDHLADADVLTVQNGLGNAETIADFVPAARVIAGTTSHGATRPDPGRVRHAGAGATRVGRYFVDNDDTVERVASLLSAAGIQTSVVENVRDAVWEKVLVNVGINAPTALARVRNGDLLRSSAGERVLADAVREGVAVAEAEGIDVPADVVDVVRSVARETASNRSSMRQDLEAGRRTEIEALNAAVVRRGDAHGIRTPVNRTLVSLVRLASDDGTE
ncbi:MAG: ketopantoate reductase family protein [Halanaeroarchaeum sp.]